MLRGILLTLLLAATLTGCARLADSRLNPFNWFGASRSAPVMDPQDRRPLVPEGRQVQIVDARVLVGSITQMSVDRTPSGAIVRATGQTDTQGYFNAELIARSIEGGVLTLEFRAEAPRDFEAEGTARSRSITAAYVIPANQLAAIRQVRVVGATNSRISSR